MLPKVFYYPYLVTLKMPFTTQVLHRNSGKGPRELQRFAAKKQTLASGMISLVLAKTSSP